MQHGSSESGVVARRSPLSTGEAAALAGCHTVTVWRAVRAGELRALRLGGRGDYRIPVDALEAWLRPAQAEDAR